MTEFTRYAIYYLPPEAEAWAVWCTAWLGWDAVQGKEVAHPVTGLPVAELTATPRKYGLHATLKPPFRLASDVTRDGLERACADLAATLAPATAPALGRARLGRFQALCPEGDASQLNALAAHCVRDLDALRAPPTQAELDRRRARGLGPAQERNMMEWGYPHVMAQFRFHITLTGRLHQPLRDDADRLLQEALAPHLPRPFRIDAIALVGEAPDGRFHLIRRFALTGKSAAPPKRSDRS
ncbi:MAG: DUF1045 domain-containing protein [Pseudomonadota bacterium]|nr:DUF1045 domain-containing protein [Pseudomonadota bacterium]